MRLRARAPRTAPQPATGDYDPTKLVLAEYEALKDEQMRRISQRDGLIYATLGAVAAVLVAAFRTAAPTLLLALPPAAAVLGWTYLANDIKVSQIGRYIRTDLIPHLTAQLPQDAPRPFGWETRHRSTSGRRTHKASQMVIDLTAFCAPAGAALAVLWTQHHLPAWAITISVAELAMTAALAYQIIRCTDLNADPTT